MSVGVFSINHGGCLHARFQVAGRRTGWSLATAGGAKRNTGRRGATMSTEARPQEGCATLNFEKCFTAGNGVRSPGRCDGERRGSRRGRADATVREGMVGSPWVVTQNGGRAARRRPVGRRRPRKVVPRLTGETSTLLVATHKRCPITQGWGGESNGSANNKRWRVFLTQADTVVRRPTPAPDTNTTGSSNSASFQRRQQPTAGNRQSRRGNGGKKQKRRPVGW